jgi:hypothetical protein
VLAEPAFELGKKTKGIVAEDLSPDSQRVFFASCKIGSAMRLGVPGT